MKDNQEYLIAEPEDVIYALNLVKDTFPEMILGLEERIMKIYKEFYECWRENNIVTSRLLAQKMQVSQTTANQYLKLLVDVGLAERLEEKTETGAYQYVPRDISKIKEALEINEEELRIYHEKWFERYGAYFKKITVEEVMK